MTFYWLNANGETSINGTQYARWDGSNRPIVRLRLAECGSPSVIMAHLNEGGLSVQGKEGLERIASEMSGVTKFPAVQIVDRPGWNGSYYALSHGEVFGPANLEPATAAFGAALNAAAVAGSAKAWRRDVAKPITGQEIPILAIALALAAPLLDPVGFRDGGIFELIGPNGSGKTLIQQMAASVFGDVDRAIVPFGYLNVDLSKYRARSGDGLMLIGDPQLSLAGQAAAKIAISVRDVVIGLRGVTGSDDGAQRPIVTLITARERLLEQVGAESPVGKVIEDRLITLELGQDDGLGVFTHMPDEYDSVSAFAKVVLAAARRLHGEVGQQYLKRLVQDRANDEAGLVAGLRRSVDFFQRKAGVDPENAREVNTAELFGLAYAAARLAIDYKLLPKDWEPGPAILACFQRWRRGRLPALPFDQTLEAIASDPRTLRLHTDPAPKRKAVKEAMAFLTERKGSRELLILPQYRAQLLPSWGGQRPPAGLVEFLVKEDGHFTVYRRLRKGVRLRVHAFRLPPEQAG